jgi:hypothetical protein
MVRRCPISGSRAATARRIGPVASGVQRGWLISLYTIIVAIVDNIPDVRLRRQTSAGHHIGKPETRNAANLFDRDQCLLLGPVLQAF